MKNTLHIILSLSLIGAFSGGVLALLNGWAAPLIEANKKAATERAIFLVQPQAVSYRLLAGIDFEAYEVLDGQEAVVGYAMAYVGDGFQGDIRVMVGLNAGLDEITAIEILEQHETPGLGTLITEADFLDQFAGLGTSLPVEWIKGALPSRPNEVQAITGATISSKAVVMIVNEGVERLTGYLGAGD